MELPKAITIFLDSLTDEEVQQVMTRPMQPDYMQGEIVCLVETARPHSLATELNLPRHRILWSAACAYDALCKFDDEGTFVHTLPGRPRTAEVNNRIRGYLMLRRAATNRMKNRPIIIGPSVFQDMVVEVQGITPLLSPPKWRSKHSCGPCKTVT